MSIKYFKATNIINEVVGICVTNEKNPNDFLFEQFEQSQYSINFEQIDQLEYIMIGLEKDSVSTKD